jgi:hypothetical protein
VLEDWCPLLKSGSWPWYLVVDALQLELSAEKSSESVLLGEALEEGMKSSLKI